MDPALSGPMTISLWRAASGCQPYVFFGVHDVRGRCIVCTGGGIWNLDQKEPNRNAGVFAGMCHMGDSEVVAAGVNVTLLVAACSMESCSRPRWEC